MATGTNHWKLGLFVLAGIAVALASLVALGARNWNQASVSYKSYFDESVQGLELGSPVKFRGVTIGRVSAIDIAPDQRHVEVTSELTLAQLGRLNLGTNDERALTIHPDLRAQLAQTGITGVKFVLIDYFDGAATPLLALPFAPDENHIPSAASTLKNLESSVVKTADRFPEIAEDLSETMSKLNGLMDDVEREQVPSRATDTLMQTSLAVQELRAQLRALDAGMLASAAQKTLGSFDATLGRVNRLLDRVEREDGVLASAERAMASLDEVARGGHAIGPEVEATLRDVRSAARSIRRFADTLERDPDMLLKGRAEGSR
jgi:ABC-type transporter Mla subunit MlaD